MLPPAIVLLLYHHFFQFRTAVASIKMYSVAAIIVGTAASILYTYV